MLFEDMEKKGAKIWNEYGNLSVGLVISIIFI